MNDLKGNDSGTYMLLYHIPNEDSKLSDLMGVMLVVTGLKVTMFPSADVTEGQRVTLTCSTSCPLMDNTSYIWYFNSQPLNGSENQNKHLDLDPVSSLHAGNYSCAVTTPSYVRSLEEALTVEDLAHAVGILNILKVVVLFLIPSLFVTLHFMMR
ncbi:sialoadhesin-like [Cololabis saira]|uniref:sialoadhesin-like n=1 Tax=Cololabis saira TaxID=129043 RepID=UPI002AD41759|nr:sialoadhesin-like [Cololabis saira]